MSDYTVTWYGYSFVAKFQNGILKNHWQDMIGALPESDKRELARRLRNVTDTNGWDGELGHAIHVGGGKFDVDISPDVLKRGSDFARSVIAHELAHCLVNFQAADDLERERLADAKAAEWGFRSYGAAAYIRHSK